MDVESSLHQPVRQPSAGSWTLWLTTADDSRPVNTLSALSVDVILCGTGGTTNAKVLSHSQQANDNSVAFKASSTEKFVVSTIMF